MSMGQPDMRFLQGETYAPVGAPPAPGGVTRGLKLDPGTQYLKGLKSGYYKPTVLASVPLAGIPVGPGGVKALIKPVLKIAATMLAAEALTPNIDIFGGAFKQYAPSAGTGTTSMTSTSGGAPRGGTAMSMGVMPYGIRGPGVPEPAAGTWTKKWQTKSLTKEGGAYWVYFWAMVDGYTIMYDTRTGGWKRWKPRKSIVLSADPRISNISRAVRATEGKLKRLAKRTKHLKYS